jgi:MFS family permease
MTVSSPSRALALAALTATQLMVILDGTIVNVALPTIRADLGFTAVGLAWVVNAFFVPFVLLLLPAGRVADLVGPRRVFVSGLVAFTTASALCGVSPGPAALVAARLLQGAGGALATTVVLGMIARLFDDDPARRNRAFGLLAFVGAAGASIGVVAGGLLVAWASWRWVFLVNVPMGLLALLLALRHLEGGAPERGQGRGSALRRAGQGRAALSVVVLLRRPRFVTANAVLFTMTTAGFSFQFLSALYLQDVLGLDPVRTGLSYLPVTLTIAVSSLWLSPRLTARHGGTSVLVAGLLLFTAGLLLLSRTPADGAFWRDVAPPFVVMGAGFGLAMPQVTSIAVADAPAAHNGVASGLVNATQQAGGVAGLAVVSLIAASAGLGAGLLVAAATLAVGTMVAVSRLRTSPRSEPAPTAAAQSPVR